MSPEGVDIISLVVSTYVTTYEMTSEMIPFLCKFQLWLDVKHLQPDPAWHIADSSVAHDRIFEIELHHVKFHQRLASVFAYWMFAYWMFAMSLVPKHTMIFINTNFFTFCVFFYILLATRKRFFKPCVGHLASIFSSCFLLFFFVNCTGW